MFFAYLVALVLSAHLNVGTPALAPHAANIAGSPKSADPGRMHQSDTGGTPFGSADSETTDSGG